jgi:hypothetical protein
MTEQWFSHKKQIPQLLELLARWQVGGSAALKENISRLGHVITRRGIVILLSDLWEEEDPRNTLAALSGRGLQVSIIQVLSPEEMTPAPEGMLRLLDSETSSSMRINLEPALVKAYQSELRKFSQDWKSFCHDHGMNYSQVLTSQPLKDVLLEKLTRCGIVAR